MADAEKVTGSDAYAARIVQLQAELPAKAEGFGPPCSNRERWGAYAASLHSQIVEAEKIAASPIPPWNDDDYLDFSRTGERPRGEKMLHARQGRLAPLVLAECGEHQGRFLPALTSLLDALAEQPTWTLPAHDASLTSYHRVRYRVELNSAVLAYELGETLYLLGDEIPAATRKRVKDALEQRIFAPMRTAYAGGASDFWLRGHSNWNAVCLYGVTGAALAALPSRSDRALFAAAGEYFSSNYLLSFSSDGYSEEGIGYWSYGFTHYALLRETLWHATAGKVDLFDDPRVESIALFGRRFQMLPGVMADFGDARFGLQPNDGLIGYVDHVYGLPMTEAVSSPSYFGDSLVEKVVALFPNASTRTSQPDVMRGDPLRHYFPVAGVLVSRPAVGGDFAITIKGGGNGGHSHNDVGSFSIGLGTEQVLGDPGGPMAYNASTFSDKRFESRLLNSYGHPVPTIGGSLQKDATSVQPKVLSVKLEPDQDSFKLDMTSAYAWPTLAGFTRSMTHVRKGSGVVVVEDSFELNGPTEIEEALPTHGSFRQVDGRTFLFQMGAQRVEVSVDAPGAVTVRQEEIKEYGNPFLRVGLHVSMTKSGTIKMTFRPVTR